MNFVVNMTFFLSASWCFISGGYELDHAISRSRRCAVSFTNVSPKTMSAVSFKRQYYLEFGCFSLELSHTDTVSCELRSHTALVLSIYCLPLMSVGKRKGMEEELFGQKRGREDVCG